MKANKHPEVAGSAAVVANAEASDNKMDQIRELMFGGGMPTETCTACMSNSPGGRKTARGERS